MFLGPEMTFKGSSGRTSKRDAADNLNPTINLSDLERFRKKNQVQLMEQSETLLQMSVDDQ